jgi:peptidoglycan/LPS O-acetylase OafA/YrhL
VKPLGLAAIVLLGFGVVFYSQAASPNYRGLFVYLVPVVLLQITLGALYFRFVPSRSRWVALAASAVALLAFSELGLRVLS